MKKSIVLKMLAGVTTTVLTVAGIAVPMTNSSNQNTADVSVVAEEAVQVAETAVDMEITSDEINIVAESMAKSEYIVNDEQSIGIAAADVQSDEAEEKTGAEQKNEAVKKSGTEQKTGVKKESATEQKSEAEQKSDAGQKPDTEQKPDVGQKSDTEQKSDVGQKPDTEQKSDVGQNPDNNDGAVPSTAENNVVGVVEDTGNTTAEQKSDNNINTQINRDGKEHIAWDSDECTITGTVEGTGTKNEGTGIDEVITDENPEPTVPEEPVEEVDEDCVVGHRYCVCGASFEFRKNSGLDKDAWYAHVQEHVAKGEMVRWTDK